MEISFAPMEGVTGYIFRQVHKEFFPEADFYRAPFIAPDSTGRFKAGSLKDVFPENNRNIQLLPQILANNPAAFLAVADELASMGYDRVDLNVGCPSGTVVAKHKGAGMLSDLSSLDAFLDTVFSASKIKVCVKTRLGIKNSEEFSAILDIYQKYPLSQLTVHARTRNGMYQSAVDLDAFSQALAVFGERASYNGNIVSPDSFRSLICRFPSLRSVTVGRGAVTDPALFRVLRGGEALSSEELREFHDRLVSETLRSGLSEYFTVGRMKELWYYMIHKFPGSEKQLKAINKAKHLDEYSTAVSSLFSSGHFESSSFFPV